MEHEPAAQPYEHTLAPQVPLFACLTKFDGTTFQEMMNGDRRQYVITKLPQARQHTGLQPG